jgi:hypothetical protein
LYTFNKYSEFLAFLLGTALPNENSIQEDIISRGKSLNACYLLMQHLLSSSLLSKNLKIMIYRTIILPVVWLCRTIILPVVWYGCETWLLALREEGRVGAFENGLLARICGPRRDEVTGAE